MLDVFIDRAITAEVFVSFIAHIVLLHNMIVTIIIQLIIACSL